MQLNGLGITALAGVLLLAACDGGGETKPVPTTGTLGLTLEVSPAVAGFSPNVEVRRGGAVVWTITSLGRSERKLEAGIYTITAGTPPTNYQARLSVGADNISSNQLEVKANQTLEARLSFAQGFGSLRVTVTPPTGVTGFTPSVMVRNAANATVATFSQSATIDNLPVGSYSVEPTAVSAQGVPWAGSASPSPANVTLSTTPEVNVSYAATRSILTVNLSGLGASDAASVTLSRSDGSGTPVVQNRNGNGPVVFADLPFASYTVRASSTRTGTYIDSAVGYTSPAPVVTASTNLSTILRSVDAPMTAEPFSATAFMVGNGALNNSGWSPSNSGASPVSVPGTLQGTDGGYFVASSSLPGDGAGVAPTANFTVPSANSLTATGPTVASALGAPGVSKVKFDPAGNLYVVYQFVCSVVNTSPCPSNTSFNRIVRISRANLLAGRFAETDAGNRLLVDSATGGEISGTFLNNVADITFDSGGNLWIANSAANRIACVSAGQMNSGTGRLTRANRIWVGPNLSFTDLRNFQDPQTLAFDASGNLWVAGGELQVNAYVTPPVNTRLPRLTRTAITAGNDCSGALTDTPITVTPSEGFDIGLTGVSDPVYQPRGMIYSPAANALWFGDYGTGSDMFADGCTTQGSINVNANRETVVKFSLASRRITNRLTVGAADTTAVGKGMQQVNQLALDSRGNLWVATNNNVEVDPARSCYASARGDVIPGSPATAGPISALLTDRFGKVYVIGAAQLADNASSPTARNAVTPLLTLSSPTAGVGFTGLALR